MLLKAVAIVVGVYVLYIVVTTLAYASLFAPTEHELKTSCRIPRQIHQTHKSQKYIQSQPDLLAAQTSWAKHEDWKHRFWSDADAEDYIVRTQSPRVIRAY